MSIAWLKNRDDSAAPGRLWSLWDIMKPFDAALFMRFMEAAGMTRTLEALVGEVSIKERWVRDWLILMDLYEQPCVELELRASAATIRKLRAELTKPNPLSTKIDPLTTELAGRLYDEMGGRHFLAFNLKEAELYNSPYKGWEQVLHRFQNTMTDVEEAGKCMALGRYTAAVFHLMRTTEAAVLELQCFLDTEPDSKAHFGSVLQKLGHLQQKTNFNNLPEHLKPYRGFLGEVLPQLHAVKDSWRNKVSHIDDRIIIADVFTEEMASGVYNATLLLMKKLADGLPKNDGKTEFDES